MPVRWIDEVLDIALERPLTPREVGEALAEAAHPEAGAPAERSGARH